MPRKRSTVGSGQPHLRKDGRWELKVTTGREPATGKLIRKTVYAATAAECAKKARSIAVAVDRGTYQEPSKMTLNTWLDIWLSEYCAAIKPGTKKTYTDAAKNHIRPALGHVKLSSLMPHQIQTFINNTQRGEKAVSAKTAKNIHGVLSKALSEAVRIKYIAFNPANGCILPKISKFDIKPLETCDVVRFVEAIKGNPSEHLFFTALYTSMRLSELLGLRWSRVDFETGTIKVDAQMLVKRGKEIARELGTPKNSSPRSFKAAPAVIDCLCAVQTEQDVWQVRAGDLWDNKLDLVFTDEIGHEIPHATVEHRFTAIMKKLGLPGHRFHDLRHTFATEALRAGVDAKTISEALGHVSVAFTLDVYAGFTDAMQSDAAARLQAAILSHQGQCVKA